MFDRELDKRNRKIIAALKQQTETLCTDAEAARAYLYKHGLVYDSDSNPVFEDPNPNSKYLAAIEITYTPPVAPKWTIEITSENPYYYHLVEDALDPVTRAAYRLKEPLRIWLEQHPTCYQMTIDRGDWGDGDEWFTIDFNEEAAAHEFLAVCNQVRAQSR